MESQQQEMSRRIDELFDVHAARVDAIYDKAIAEAREMSKPPKTPIKIPKVESFFNIDIVLFGIWIAFWLIVGFLSNHVR